MGSKYCETFREVSLIASTDTGTRRHVARDTGAAQLRRQQSLPPGDRRRTGVRFAPGEVTCHTASRVTCHASRVTLYITLVADAEREHHVEARQQQDKYFYGEGTMICSRTAETWPWIDISRYRYISRYIYLHIYLSKLSSSATIDHWPGAAAQRSGRPRLW